MPRALIALAILLVPIGLSVGCGGNETVISAGSFLLTDEGIFPEKLREATLEIEPGKAAGTLTLKDSGASTDFQLEARARTDWATGCDGAFTSADLETLDIKPDPLSIGDFALKSPRLTATCSGSGLDLRADPDNDAGDFTRSYRFTRQAQ